MVNEKPLYLEIVGKLRERILHKEFSSQQKLPSEYDLALQYNVSRLTIRKAIDNLINQNLLVKQRGKGTYVMIDNKIQSGRYGLQSFSEVAKIQGKKSQTQLLNFETNIKVSEVIRKKIGVSDKSPVCWIQRLRLLDNEPMVIEEIYIERKYLEGFSEMDLKSSIFQLLERNIEISYSHQEIEAILPDDKICKLLGIKNGEPVLFVQSTTFTATGQPLLYDISYYRSDRYSFKNTLVRKKEI